MDTINMKSNFSDELHKNRKNLAYNTSFLSDEKYNELIEIISELKAGRKKKDSKDFHLIKSQSQGSVERANQDIENMLTTWMQDDKNRHWREGLRFIQLMKNRAYHSGIKMSPYEALFGCKIKIGLNTSNLPYDVIKQSQNIENEVSADTEEQLGTTIKLNNENANVMRTRAKDNLENQAKKMMAWSDMKLLPVAIYSTVRVPVPEVDKGPLDVRSILAIVLEVTSDGFYRLCTRDGVLKQLYARSQFAVCQ
ncbi:hypothetical protein QTP88_008372 [Uroleucon formosanum]